MRVCNKPGQATKRGAKVYRFSSPMLSAGFMLDECPIGYILREAPYVFDVLNVHAYSDNVGFELLRQSRWVQDAFRIVASEKARLFEIEQDERKTKADAQKSAALLKG